MKLSLVLDFDGTVTTTDICVAIVREFIGPGWDDGLNRWRAGEIDQRQLMEWEFARLPGDRAEEMREYALREATVRAGLADLLELCRSYDVPVEVVSNGMSFYIEAVLDREGLSDLPFVAPIPTLNGLNGPAAEFGDGVETCERTGLCKCARARRLRSDGRKIVFVGDGISDFCVADEADFVIARSSLKEHCAKQGIAHTEFRDFNDVRRRVAELIEA
ncbi:MAG: HAD-IB family phosphatase [Chloroflexi bacterium]|nr:HAD-IB family phosphatase [Chloroflexota bacterium]